MINIKTKIAVIKLLFLFCSVLFLSACSNTDSKDASLSLSFYSEQSLGKISADSLKLDSAKFFLYDVKIKDLTRADTNVVKVGPFVVYLNMNGMTTDFAVSNIPPGNYEQVKFEIHTVKDNESIPDSEFVVGSFRYSGIIKGSFNSQPFIYKYDKTAKQNLKLAAPIVVGQNGVANLTIIVDPNSWFVKDGNLLNPSDPLNHNVINDNIKQSFKKVVLDNNHDGLADSY